MTQVVGKNPEEIARIRTAIAAEYIRGGKLDDAKRQLESALKVVLSKSAEANDMMGVLLQQEGSPRNMQKPTYFKTPSPSILTLVKQTTIICVYLAQLSHVTKLRLPSFKLRVLP